MKFSLITLLKKVKASTKIVATLSDREKRNVLETLVRELLKEKGAIQEANNTDILLAKKNGKNVAFLDRLTISDKVFENILSQLKAIAQQKDYSSEIIEKRKIINGVMLEKVRVPLGVVGIIYESRPNITIDVAALCIKSGNAVILRGGSDAWNTNKILIRCIHKALAHNGFTKDIVGFVEDTNRKVVTTLLQQEKFLDVIIPRGGYDLVKKVVTESKISVLYHASGGARIYVDKSADIALAVKVCINAKINRPGTCNSLDTILVQKDIAKDFLQEFEKKLNKRAEIRADNIALQYIKAKKATKKDYETEFLDYILSIKVVVGVNEALHFIEKYSNLHTEGIVATNTDIIKQFVTCVDAAAIFVNASTRLHDGGVFALGAEMGIATGKLHARGPVGAKELTTYKWVAYGKGQIRE